MLTFNLTKPKTSIVHSSQETVGAPCSFVHVLEILFLIFIFDSRKFITKFIFNKDEQRCCVVSLEPTPWSWFWFFKAQTNEQKIFPKNSWRVAFKSPKENFQKRCQWFTQVPSREAAWFRETEEGPCQSLHVQFQSVPGAVRLQIIKDFFTKLIKRNVPIANCKVIECNLRSDSTGTCRWKRCQLGKQYLRTLEK